MIKSKTENACLFVNVVASSDVRLKEYQRK